MCRRFLTYVYVVVWRLDIVWSLDSGRAAVTCHTTSMFAFLWQRRCLNSTRTQHWIGPGLTVSQFAPGNPKT